MKPHRPSFIQIEMEARSGLTWRGRSGMARIELMVEVSAGCIGLTGTDRTGRESFRGELQET